MLDASIRSKKTADEIRATASEPSRKWHIITTRLPIIGSTALLLQTDYERRPNFIVVDTTSAYWTNYGDCKVMKVVLAGGAPIELASGQNSPVGIAGDATSVTWVNEDGGTVMRLTPK